ncbi:HdeD family acid-resistance protein [Stakelama tenebrarum]|uniref:HdeD family acid-resistance protein n=1 Tax=Stakelama tenebrarum TaxID=2711215 RepID=A0A6G6Y4N5_9SPHN|nr:DUF308 domain-containing protein [Sphingosinithalassobacter tenebrarum]QIG79914.1 hypothetical protein G5C33_09075 [Sphingosinithalassobacter tenebrarum]
MAETGETAAENSWGWMMAMAVLTILLGIFLLATPYFTALMTGMVMGFSLALLGVGGIVMGIRAVRPRRRWLDILLGAAALLIGLYTWIFPLAGTLSLTLLLGVWLVLRGIAELFAISQLHDGGGRGLLLLSGLLDLVVGVFLLAYYPFPAMAYLGIFVAVSFLMGGFALFVAALGLRRLEKGLA